MQKPKIKKGDLGYMNNLERNTKPNILVDPRPLTKLSLINNNAIVVLSTKLRILVNDSPAENRAVVEQAAQTLELVL